jgi:hypothetical protein
MKEKILNLENFNEIAFDLIKKENGNSEVIKYEVNSSDRLSESVIEEIFKMRNEENISFKEATKEVIENEPDLMFILDDKIDYLAETVVEKYSQYDENNDDFYDLKMEIRDFITNNFEKDYSIDEILKNTPINELSVFLKEPTSDYPEDSERNNVPFGEFCYTDELDIIKDEYSSIAFLIQSQGYEDEYLSIGNEGSVGFFKGKNSSNLSELFDVLDNEDNLKIPKELATVGLLGLGNYGTSHLTVELEKDIILSKDDYKVFSEFSSGNTFNEKELLLEGYFGKSNEKSMFTSTKEESFKMHEIDLDKIKDNVREYYKGELEEVNKIVEMEK